MAIAGKPTQQPNDVQDYDLDFTGWLPDGDFIKTATIACLPTMPTPPSFAINHPYVKVWVYAGGTSGTSYKITVKATSNDGRVRETELVVKVKEI